MTRYALALPRCASLVGLTLVGFGYGLLLLVAATLVVPYPYAVVGQFRLAALGRRLAGAWGGVHIPLVERTPPPVPQRREDGWYAHGGTLFRSPRMPAFLLRLDHLGKDPAGCHEWRWLLVAPVTAAITVLVPPVLLAAALFLLVSDPWAPVWSVPAALGSIVVAVLSAPVALRAYGLCTRLLLQTGERSWWHRSTFGRWVRQTSIAVWRRAGLEGLALAAVGGTLLNLLAVTISWGGLLPYVPRISRPLVERYRRYARRWTGADLPSPYRPFPPLPPLGEDGTYRVGRSLHTDRAAAVRHQRQSWLLGDPATWRDQLWTFGTVVLAPLSLVPALLLAFGFFGLVWQPLTWVLWGLPLNLFADIWVDPFYVWPTVGLLVPASTRLPDWVSIPVGLALALLGLALAGPLARVRRWWDRLLLTPTASTVLASRIAHLTTTRAEVADAQAVELRRIERDLHDGAQARLVAVGLGLAAVARLIEADPVRARQMLAQAQEASAAALAELRRLVRGIHPPVLAERGLGDAVRAIALDTPLPVDVDIDLPVRLEAPIESAAYFATCEALANAARVASRVSVVLSHRDGVLRIVVTDDGPGGADPARGSGLRGIGRRLATFDGTMTLHSPPGGPTVVTLEIPCASSSPKTSTC